MRIFSLILFLACSSSSDKLRTTDKVSFDGGTFKESTWKEKLVFNRATWFSQSHLEFDTFIGELKKDSQFTKWFSASEKKFLRECAKLFVSISTSNRSRVLTDGMYMSQMRLNDMSEIIPTHFIENLKLHHDYVRWNLTMYRPRLLCAEKNVDIVKIDFPSFKTVKLNL